MIRLLLLTSATIFVALLFFGDRNGPIEPATANNSEASENSASVTEENAPSPDTAEAAPEIDDVEQTTLTEQQFAGPELRPSPEYANQTEAEREQALTSDTTIQIVYVTGSRVNFREGPSTSNRVIGALNEGSPVEALGPAQDGWAQIRDSQGRVGYMSAQFLSPNRP